ncbi:MAG: chemoreceptor glutamine deamidase CheD [Elsteraceae bacterium]
MALASTRRRSADLEIPRASGRYWDNSLDAYVVKVLPGEHYVTRAADETISTVLGSCVAACIRDPVAAVGGMNHFMLPGEVRGTWSGATNEMRYGQFAMEKLINDILACGGRRERLEVKLFGGANVMNSSMKIGDSNAEFVLSFMKTEGLMVAAQDLGGDLARRINYFPLSGRVFRLELRRQPDVEVFEEELSYRDRLRQQAVGGSIELFD